jgi:hypothetical protein
MLAKDTVFVVFMGTNRIFGLVFECSSDQGIGRALHPLSNNHRGKDIASNIVHSFKRLPPLKQLRDRATLNLPGNIVVTSFLKKKVYNARIQYTIEVKFGYLRTTQLRSCRKSLRHLSTTSNLLPFNTHRPLNHSRSFEFSRLATRHPSRRCNM